MKIYIGEHIYHRLFQPHGYRREKSHVLLLVFVFCSFPYLQASLSSYSFKKYLPGRIRGEDYMNPYKYRQYYLAGICFMQLGQRSVGLYSRKVKATDFLADAGQTQYTCVADLVGNVRISKY